MSESQPKTNPLKGFLRSSVNLLPASARHWIKHIPGVAGGQRWLVKSLLSGDAFIHVINAGPAKGLCFEVTLPHDKAIWAGTYEPEVSQTLHSAVHKGDVCYDIGGYRGYMAGVFAVASASRVMVFEPLPDNLVHLKRFVELNPTLPIQVEEKAVGKTDGEVRFKVMPDRTMGKLAVSSFQEEQTISGEITVQLVSLDSCIFKRNFPRPNLMKIDVEGAECDVLEGAIRTLQECRPRILIEAHSQKLEELCIQIVRDSGYQCRRLNDGHFAPQQPRHLWAQPS